MNTNNQHLKRDLFLTIISFAVLLTVNFVIWQIVRSNFYSNIKNKFLSDTKDVKHELKMEIKRHQDYLETGTSFYSSSQNVTRLEFDSFFKNGLCGQSGTDSVVTYIEKTDSVKALEARVRSEGGRSIYFKVYPEASQSSHYVINYISPWDKNNKYFGYDVSTDSDLAQYFDRALKENRVVASDIKVFIDKKSLVFVKPVFENGKTVESETQRSQATKGFLALFVDPDELFRKVLDNENYRDFTMSVYEGEQTTETVSKNTPIFTNLVEEPFAQDNTNYLEDVSQFDIAGKTYTLYFKNPFSSRENLFQRYYPDLNLVISNLIVLLFYVFLIRFKYSDKD